MFDCFNKIKLCQEVERGLSDLISGDKEIAENDNDDIYGYIKVCFITLIS